MKTTLLFVLILVNTNIVGQQTETLLINVSKSEVKDGFYIYDISVQNRSDSIVCMLHSIFVNLTADIPQGLALYIKSKDEEEYSLHRSFEDTTYDAEAMPRKGECILPRQTLNFKIKILQPTNNISKYLTVQYFYLTELCYKDFIKEMKNKVGSWYYKYNRLQKSVKI
jgi:hypothetical protein